jgi:hypothetical protein
MKYPAKRQTKGVIAKKHSCCGSSSHYSEKHPSKNEDLKIIESKIFYEVITKQNRTKRLSMARNKKQNDKVMSVKNG